MRIVRIATILAFAASSHAAAQQQPMPGEAIYELYKLRGRDNCSANASCNATFNSWYGFNAGEMNQSTSNKKCAQVEIESVEGARYAVRAPLPQFGAQDLPAFRAALEQRMKQGETPFGLETWQGRKLVLVPSRIMSADVRRCG